MLRRSMLCPQALALAAACGLGTTCAAAQPLPADELQRQLAGQSVSWSEADGRQFTLFLEPDGTGEARTMASADDGWGQALFTSMSGTWSLDGNGRLCLAFAAGDSSLSECGRVERTDAGLALVADDGVPLATATARGLFGRVTLEVEDLTGRTEPAALRAMDADGTTVAAGDTIRLAPGSWTVAPAADPSAALPVEVAAGVGRTAHVRLADALWLTESAEPAAGNRAGILVRLRPQDERRALLQRFIIARKDFEASEPKSSATAADRAEALRVARAWADDPKGNDQVRALARQLLKHFGDAGDIARLANLETAEPAVATAFLEARLGQLETGVLAAAAGGDDPAKAFAALTGLAAFGYHPDDRRLLAFAAEPSASSDYWHRSSVLEALYGAPPALALAAARATFDQWEAEERAIATEPARADGTRRPNLVPLYTAVPIILAYGERDDLRRFAALQANGWTVELAPYFVDLPGLLDRLWPLDEIQPWNGRYLCTLLEGLPRAEALQAWSQLRASYAERVAAKEGPTTSTLRDVALFQARFRFDIVTSPCMPTNPAAELYDRDGTGWLIPSIREEATEGQILSGVAQRNLGPDWWSQLDYIAHDRVAAALASTATADDTEGALILAFHKTMRFGCASAACRLFRCGDVRSYALRIRQQDKYGGAIAGLLAVKPALAGSRLDVTVQVQHEVYYHDYCDMAAMVANGCDIAQWLVHPWSEAPEKLIADVQLRRGSDDLPLQEAAAEPGQRRFSAEIGARGLADLYLFVTLAMGDDRREFAIPLFDSAFAHLARADSL